jgi:hypothetical protein
MFAEPTPQASCSNWDRKDLAPGGRVWMRREEFCPTVFISSLRALLARLFGFK